MGNVDDILLKDIEDSLFQLRDSVGNPYDAYEKLFSYLDDKLDLKFFEWEVVLIRAIKQVFKNFTLDADIVLMTLGLLDGYSYKVIYRHTDRRIKFLRETAYLGFQKPPYDEASKSKQESYRKTIRNDENERLHILANFLKDNRRKLGDFLVDIEDYTDDGMAILPTPGYIEGKPLRNRKKKAVITFSISKQKLFTTNSDIVINKDDEYEMAVDLSTAINFHKKRKISTLSTVILVLLFTSLSMTTIIYTQKNTLDKSQEPNMENQAGDDTGRKYQTKDDIMGVLERTGQKLEVRPYTLGSSSENGNTVSPF